MLPLYTVKMVEEAPFTEYTPELVKFGGKCIFDDVMLDIAEPFRYCFSMGGEVWMGGTDGRLRIADLKGTRISGKLVQPIA